MLVHLWQQLTRHSIPNWISQHWTWGKFSTIELSNGFRKDGSQRPLRRVVVLHGRGATAEAIVGPWDRCQRPVEIIIPKATHPVGEGFAWASASVTDRDDDRLARELGSASKQLHRTLVKRWGSEEALRQDPPFITGFSQGSMLAFTYAVMYPGQVRGLGLAATWLPRLWQGRLTSPKALGPLRVAHNQDDPIVPCEPTSRLLAELRDAGADLRFKIFPKGGHAITQDMWEWWSAELVAMVDAS